MSKAELLTSFRDFFFYGNSQAMESSYQAIKDLTGTQTPLPAINWQEEEFIFNRLFVGPASPTAPFIASVYIDPEEMVQGKVTKDVRHFYESIGLSLANTGTMPEDSLPLELDACAYLLHLSKESPTAEELYQAFIDEHIALWLPLFTESALSLCERSLALRDVLNLMKSWITEESGTSIHKELS